MHGPAVAEESPIEGTDLASQRDLLQSQLDDLDYFVHRARREEKAQAVAVEWQQAVAEEQWSFATPGLVDLLRSQLREVETWQEEVRANHADTDPLPARPTGLRLGHLLRLQSCRQRAERVEGAEEACRVQRLQLSREALSLARQAEAERSLALEQARGVQLHSGEDLARLAAQLQALEVDANRPPELARLAGADVALAFVGAIEQRRSLARQLASARAVWDELRSLVWAHEHLLACANAAPFDATRDGRLLAPAARLALRGVVHSPGPAIARLNHIAQRNADLWQQFSDAATGCANGDGFSSDLPLPAPLVPPISCGDAGGAPGALQVELQELRALEGRLDALLLEQTAPGGYGQPRSARRDGGLGLSNFYAPGRFPSGISFRCVFDEWWRVAGDSRAFRKMLRQNAVKRLLGGRSAAVVLRMAGMWSAYVERRVPAIIKRGELVVDRRTGHVGQMLSMTLKRICKVEFGNECRLVSADALWWLQQSPHPAVAYLCFQAWRLLVKLRMDALVKDFRKGMILSKRGDKNGRGLTWLAVSADDPSLRLRLCFAAWAKEISAARKDLHKRLVKAWSAWQHGVLLSRHNRAVQDLEQTTGELQNARMAVLRQTQRFERLEGKFEQLDDMVARLWASWALNAWQWCCKLGSATRNVTMNFREERLETTNIFTRKLIIGNRKHWWKLTFRSWSAWSRDRAAQRRVLRKHAREQKVHALEVLYRRAFAEWAAEATRLAKSRAETHAADLEGRWLSTQQELQGLRKLSQHAYEFAECQVSRVRILENALQKADVALKTSTEHRHALGRSLHQSEEQFDVDVQHAVAKRMGGLRQESAGFHR